MTGIVMTEMAIKELRYALNGEWNGLEFVCELVKNQLAVLDRMEIGTAIEFRDEADIDEENIDDSMLIQLALGYYGLDQKFADA